MYILFQLWSLKSYLRTCLFFNLNILQSVHELYDVFLGVVNRCSNIPFAQRMAKVSKNVGSLWPRSPDSYFNLHESGA